MKKIAINPRELAKRIEFILSDEFRANDTDLDERESFRKDALGLVAYELAHAREFRVPCGLGPCRDCGASPTYAVLEVSGMSGFSASSAHDHAPDCPKVVCPHGIRWADPDLDCSGCEADRALEDADTDEAF